MAKKFNEFRKKRPKSTRVTKPLWRIEDGITFSALSKWLECREQFALQWIDGLTPKRLSIPLEFGSVIHHALEHQFKGPPREVIHTVTEQYRKHRGKTLTNSSDRDKLNVLLGMAEILFPRYCEYWAYDDAQINWIGREQKFKVKYSFPCPEGGTRDVFLCGMRDGLYSYGSTYGVFETKTKSRIVESEIQDRLHSDMQTMMYCFCTFLETGRYPNQIKYNVIKRPDIYRRNGENLHSYLRRVEEKVLAEPENYFRRFTANLIMSDITTFVNKTLNPVLNMFCVWYDSIKKNPVGEARFQSPYHFLNSLALVSKYGKAEMWDAIFGDTQSYTVRKDVFPELSDVFQVTFQEQSQEVFNGDNR